MSSYRRDFFKRLALLFSGPVAPSPAAQAAGSAQPLTPGQPEEQPVRGQFDLIVVGGGISGTCAAISAARNGMRVALVHERSMLGGNSSSEVRLFPENNSGHQPWIREGGIHDELYTEERARNHQDYMEGTMNAHWDLVLYEWVVREKNISLFLNTHMHRVMLDGPELIRAIYAIQLGTEKSFELSAPLFVDATGDGVLGYRAGADFRWGREARPEYNELGAPETADEQVMGNTLFFRAVDTGRPVPFKRPDWAVEFPSEKDLTGRGHSYIEGGYWWIEVGVPYHPIRDNEEIRHEGLRQLLGVWDHIKNKGKHGAENYGLEFVGFWPYKRETRRILGDFVITEHHVLDPKPLPDSVAYGCWGVDIHVPGGILTRNLPPYPPPRTDENNERMGSMIYGIPLRALYSRKVRNLMMAGRPISCSYVGFASTRVLSTGAIVGEAVGVAASLCKKHSKTPKEIAAGHAQECQQIILRQGGHIPGVENQDPRDLARQARVTASSEWWLEFPESANRLELTRPHAQLFPVSGNRIDKLGLLLESRLTGVVKLRLGLREAPHASDFRSTRDIASAEVEIAPGFSGWLDFPLRAAVEPRKLYWIHLPNQPGVFWREFREKDGQPNRCPVASTAADLPGRVRWRPLTMGRSLCVQVSPRQHPFSPENVARGANRPDTWTNIWISDPSQSLPAWLELRWDRPQSFNTVQITFDTDANRRVTLPLFRYPDCAKDYRIESFSGNSWTAVAALSDNYMRRRVHHFTRVQADRLRLLVTATNGAPSARIYEIRVYDEA